MLCKNASFYLHVLKNTHFLTACMYCIINKPSLKFRKRCLLLKRWLVCFLDCIYVIYQQVQWNEKISVIVTNEYVKIILFIIGRQASSHQFLLILFKNDSSLYKAL